MINEHELKLVNEILISIYRRGYEDGVVETEKINDKAHDDGYNKGLYDAWEAAKKIHDGQIPYEVFGLDKTGNGISYASPLNWGENISASEAIAKIKEYEDKQKCKENQTLGYGNCSVLEDICPYDIKCVDCEVHCSLKRARNKIKELKGDKE